MVRGQRQYVAVVLPTSVGLVWYMVLSGLVLVLMNLHSLQRIFYTSEELTIQSDFWHSINDSLGKALGFTAPDTIFFYMFWGVIGLVVYGALHFTMSKLGELSDDLNLRHYIWPSERLRNRPLQQFIEISLFRLALFIITFFYVKVALNFMFQPIERIWLDNSWLAIHTGIKYCVVFLVQVLLLHGLVVLLRLMMLRKRLFGSVS